ncbi:hypothetical protein ACIGEZ_28860 [Streptomyces sp. NPDC085481]|uniref:hypothetical protein n=1 Tax=Streptomyces sp. NPDC085481 TaxID=3365727 RepID=UPI0037D02D01
MRVDGESLTLTVEDDGMGFGRGAVRRGAGLRSMADRAAEIGGRCTVETPVRGGRGGRVRAVLPRSTAPAEPASPASSLETL